MLLVFIQASVHSWCLQSDKPHVYCCLVWRFLSARSTPKCFILKPGIFLHRGSFGHLWIVCRYHQRKITSPKSIIAIYQITRHNKKQSGLQSGHCKDSKNQSIFLFLTFHYLLIWDTSSKNYSNLAEDFDT